MIPLTLREVAGIVGGRVDGDPGTLLTRPAFLDSRAPEPGGLFVAFAGERVDGHEYAAGAVAAGAAAVLGSRTTGAPTVVVDDTRSALQELARVVLSRLREQLTVVAITGSSGKTSAKDMLGRVLGDAAPTVATAGSFNNELGLPLTVLRATAETRFLVLEMGARGIGHLAELCAIAPPDVSLVLNVGKAHLGEFGSQANIAVAKGELVEALGPEGIAVLNADDPLVSAMASRTRGRVVTFGTDAADVRLSEVALDDLGRPSFALQTRPFETGPGGPPQDPGSAPPTGSVAPQEPGPRVPEEGEERARRRGPEEGEERARLEGQVHVSLRLVGEHQAVNATAVAAVATALGIPLEQVGRSLEAIETLSRWRMEVRERPDGLVVVNDAYNANPDSMRAALETLARMGGRPGRRTVAVLGAMRELGVDSEAEHRAVGEHAQRLGIDLVLVVGPDARATFDALGDAGARAGTTRHVGTLDEAEAWLSENVAGPDVVLLKASRSEGLERLAEALMREEDLG